MDETTKQRTGYHIQRDVMDEFKVDELAEKSHVHTSLADKIKETMRYEMIVIRSSQLSNRMIQVECF